MKNRKKLARTIISAVVLLALIGAAAYLIVNRDIFSGGSIEKTISGLLKKDKDQDDHIYFDVYAESSFAALNEGLAVASGAGVSVYDGQGERSASLNTQLKTPRITAGTEAALAWTSGSSGVYLIKPDEVTAVSTSGNVIGAHMNASGWFAVCAEEVGYKASATVFNDSGEAVYKWYSGEGYLIDADISPNSQRMAISTINDGGARLLSFSLDNEAVKGEYTEEDGLFLEVSFITDGKLAALTEQKLKLFPFNLSSSDEYDFSDEYLRDYSFDGDGFAALLLGLYRTGNETRLVTVDGDGRELGSVELTDEVLSLTVSGKYVSLALSDNSVRVYDEKLELVLEEKELVGLRGAYVRPDGSAAVILANEAINIKK